MAFERRGGWASRGTGGGWASRGGGGGWNRDRRGGGGGRFRDRDRGGPKPVKEGEEYDVTISEVSQRGDGIARIKNFVVFVPGTKQGDNVRIRIKDVRGSHATGEVIGAGAGTEGAAEEETPQEEMEEQAASAEQEQPAAVEEEPASAEQEQPAAVEEEASEETSEEEEKEEAEDKEEGA